MSDQAFKTQQRSFAVLGYAANPSFGAEGYVGDLAAAQANGGDFIGDVKASRATIRATKRRRKAKGTLGEFDDPDEDDDDAAVEGEDAEMQVGEDGEPKKRKKAEKKQKEYIGPWAGWEGENIATVKPTEEEWEEQDERGGKPLTKKERARPVIDAGKQIGFGEEKSTFHGQSRCDCRSGPTKLTTGARIQARSCTTTSAGRTSTSRPTSTSTSSRPSPGSRRRSFRRGASTPGPATRRVSARSSSSPAAATSSSVAVSTRASRCVAFVSRSRGPRS